MWAIIGRDLLLARRRSVDMLLPLAFIVAAVSLFPLGVSPEPAQLRLIAAGVVWVCALLTTCLSLPKMYASDLSDGSLDQLMLCPQPLALVALARAATHWVIHGLPLVLLSPLLGLMFGLPAQENLGMAIALLLGTPTLSLLGGIGAALTLGLRNASMLVILIILPMTVPVLIFGCAAVTAVAQGGSAQAHLSLLGALLCLALAGAPWATAAALRIAVE